MGGQFPVLFQTTSNKPEVLKEKFVRNRVLKIQENANGVEIRFVPGKENPADIVSRGCSAKELSTTIWFAGPRFLRKGREQWPLLPVNAANVLMATPNTSKQEIVRDTSVVQFKRFSTWKRLLRTTARVLRVVNNIKARKSGQQIVCIKAPLTVEEMESAEKFVIKCVQNECLSEEMTAIKKGEAVDKRSPLSRFSAVIINGFLCVGGRLASHQGEVNRNPVFVPPMHHVARLILKDLHEANAHAGATWVAVEVRKKYWIPRAKRLVVDMIRGCKGCRVFHLKPDQAKQGIPPLGRVSRSHPFAHVGTDVAGPLYIREGKTQKKVWVCVFTCAAVRAIHLEVLRSLDTRELLMAIRRFKARRGCPSVFYSDNARAYKRAALDLQEVSRLMQEPELRDELANEGVQWQFSTACAPREGGL